MAGNLTKNEVTSFKEAFAIFDSRKDGSIDKNELYEIMERLGCKCNDEEIKDLIGEIDEVGTGRIDFPSFLKQFQHSDDKPKDEFLDEAYKLIGNGDTISTNQIRLFMSKCGLQLIDMEFDAMIKFMDKDKDGTIGEEDFKSFFLAD